jgi:hypothetical protein
MLASLVNYYAAIAMSWIFASEKEVMPLRRGNCMSRHTPGILIYSVKNFFDRLVTHARPSEYIHKNILSEFEATGISPLNSGDVFKRQ